MSQTTIERRQLAYDIAANWTAQNPILALAEIGYETDTGKQKIGNGATAWNSLAYQVHTSGNGGVAFSVGALTATSLNVGLTVATDSRLAIYPLAQTSSTDLLFYTATKATTFSGLRLLNESWFDATAIDFYTSGLQRMRIGSGGNIIIGNNGVAVSGAKLEVAGSITSNTHNADDLGTTAVRWKDLWLQSGAFNGSDARLKTEVQPMSTAEIKAASQLSKEIGTYQWLQSVSEKGAENARLHTGLTVQRAIEIMTENGLDWTRYAFIGYDKWDDKIVEHPEILAQEATEETEAIEYQPAWTETVLKAGDAYSFRYDQLNMFIARGFEARLQALECNQTTVAS